jgi:hypothetical protein
MIATRMQIYVYTPKVREDRKVFLESLGLVIGGDLDGVTCSYDTYDVHADNDCSPPKLAVHLGSSRRDIVELSA